MKTTILLNIYFKRIIIVSYEHFKVGSASKNLKYGNLTVKPLSILGVVFFPKSL